MSKNREVVEAVIPAAGSTSATVAVPANKILLGVKTPGTLVGTTLTFKVGFVSTDTPVTMKKADGSADYSIGTVTTNKYYPVNPNDFQGVPFLQVVSNGTETGGATIQLIFGQTE